jgi:uncharacterized lipoprotein NlpE involved in copper resistance
MKKTIILAFTALLAASSCVSKNQKDSAAQQNENTEARTQAEGDGHNAQNSLSYAGTYEGTIPCADCSGIDLVITLDYEDNYTRKMTYRDRTPDNVFSTSGKFTWDATGSIITFSGEEGSNKFFVAENMLIMLDSEGNEIKGDNAGMYRLKKTGEEE